MKFFIDTANAGEIRKAHEMDLSVLKIFGRLGESSKELEKRPFLKVPFDSLIYLGSTTICLG